MTVPRFRISSAIVAIKMVMAVPAMTPVQDAAARTAELLPLDAVRLRLVGKLN
jgi:hypothetical protein